MWLQHLHVVFRDEAPLSLQLALQPAGLPRLGHCRRGHSVTGGGEGWGGGGGYSTGRVRGTDRGHRTQPSGECAACACIRVNGAQV